MNIYVGNLPRDIEENNVRLIFADFGKVHKVTLIKDRETGLGKGFGFVEMDQEAGKKAISELHEATLGDREIIVNEARPREDNRRGNDRGNNRFAGRRSY